MSKEMERLKEIEARKAELLKELGEEITEERAVEIKKEAEELKTEERKLNAEIETRNALVPNALPSEKEEGAAKMNEREERAKAFAESGKMEMRALLSTGKIATATAVTGINGLAEYENSIVDDVKAVSLTGNGAYVVAYKKRNAAAADVEDGKAIAGTGSEYDYVEINPAEWGVLDEVSNQVKKLSPLDYLGEMERSAVQGLRVKAESKIFAAIEASELKETKTVALDADYLRTLVLGFKALKGKGAAKLYLCQADLLKLGKVRGTGEKKPLYEISFDTDSISSGVISEGGLAVRFALTDCLSAGTQIYGQPQTIEMPMWDNYQVATDEGGDYFKRNMIGIRALQTANADVCAQGTIVKVTQA